MRDGLILHSTLRGAILTHQSMNMAGEMFFLKQSGFSN